MTENGIARLYIRTFPDTKNVNRMLESVELHVRHRITGVDANLTLLKPAHRTDTLIELWRYHNEDDQSWVQQSLAGANVVPDAMAPDNMIYTLDLVFQSHDSDF